MNGRKKKKKEDDRILDETQCIEAVVTVKRTLVQKMTEIIVCWDELRQRLTSIRDELTGQFITVVSEVVAPPTLEHTRISLTEEGGKRKLLEEETHTNCP